MKQPAMDPTARDAESIGLPPRFFLYTLDQIQDMLSIHKKELGRVVWYDGRDTGAVDPARLFAHNIAPDPAAKPMWRVAEPELVRWMRHKGFRLYQRGWLRSS